MSDEVKHVMAEVVTLMRELKWHVYAEMVIGNAMLLITGTVYEDAFAKELDPQTGAVKVWNDKKLRRWYTNIFLHYQSKTGAVGTRNARDLD